MPITTRALRRNVLSSFVRASLTSTLVASSAHAASVCTVVTNSDDPAGASAAVTAQTTWGTLRDCILASNLLTGAVGAPTGSMTISFDSATFTGGAANTITLGDSLPMIFNNTTIDASALTQPVVIDGGSSHRIFFVSGLPDSTQDYNATGVPDPDGALPISVTFKNLVLRNGKAKGGDGGSGGLGAGGALFVNQNASVILSDVSFTGNVARGGNFGPNGQYASGGGMGGDGLVNGGGLGGSGLGTGGGIGTDGEAYNPKASVKGGGFGGTGIGQISNQQGFGAGFNGGELKTLEAPAPGGIGGGAGIVGGGGFGGGGGDGGFAGGGYGGCNTHGKYNCKGGFGGGGGHGRNGGVQSESEHYAGSNGAVGGLGGFGGGGGGGGGGGDCKEWLGQYHPGSGNSGGLAGVGGGSGGNGTDAPANCSTTGVTGPGGGGAGLGGAVFVRKGGFLTVKAGDSRSVSGNSIVAGTGYRNGAAAGAGFFVMSGANISDPALAFDISGRYTISDDIGDDSPTTLPAGESYTPGAGAGLTVFKQGTGTLVLDGSNTFSGLVAVGVGTLAGNGDVPAAVLLADGAAIAPGDPAIAGGVGTFSTGPLVWTPGSSISFQLGNTQAASDLLMINGALTKNGSGLPLRVHFGMGAKAPVAGATYTLLTAQSLAGVVAGDFFYDHDATYSNLVGHFAVVGNSVTFTVDSLTADRIFAGSFD